MMLLVNSTAFRGRVLKSEDEGNVLWTLIGKIRDPSQKYRILSSYQIGGCSPQKIPKKPNPNLPILV